MLMCRTSQCAHFGSLTLSYYHHLHGTYNEVMAAASTSSQDEWDEQRIIRGVTKSLEVYIEKHLCRECVTERGWKGINLSGVSFVLAFFATMIH